MQSPPKRWRTANGFFSSYFSNQIWTNLITEISTRVIVPVYFYQMLHNSKILQNSFLIVLYTILTFVYSHHSPHFPPQCEEGTCNHLIVHRDLHYNIWILPPSRKSKWHRLSLIKGFVDESRIDFTTSGCCFIYFSEHHTKKGISYISISFIVLPFQFPLS